MCSVQSCDGVGRELHEVRVLRWRVQGEHRNGEGSSDDDLAEGNLFIRINTPRGITRDGILARAEPERQG